MNTGSNIVTSEEDKLLKGTVVAKHHLSLLSEKIEFLRKKNILPCLKVILVGDDPASTIYTSKKAEKCKDLGIQGDVVKMSGESSTDDILKKISELNTDSSVHGILVQLPLPKHVDSQKVLDSIAPRKDVDGFHPINVGRLQSNVSQALVPCTAQGVIALLEYYNITIPGKHVVILGRSIIVGRPLLQMLSSKNNYGNATVTICHSQTQQLEMHTTLADIIIVAIGIPLFLRTNMIKPGAIVIDVGISPTPANSTYAGRKKIVGDVDFDDVLPKVGKITPVPGGIGPLTIAMLMKNTIQAAEMSQEIYNQNNEIRRL